MRQPSENPYARIAELEQQLAREREVAELERRRAALLKESLERAWRLSSWRDNKRESAT